MAIALQSAASARPPSDRITRAHPGFFLSFFFLQSLHQDHVKKRHYYHRIQRHTGQMSNYDGIEYLIHLPYIPRYAQTILRARNTRARERTNVAYKSRVNNGQDSEKRPSPKFKSAQAGASFCQHVRNPKSEEIIVKRRNSLEYEISHGGSIAISSRGKQ